MSSIYTVQDKKRQWHKVLLVIVLFLVLLGAGGAITVRRIYHDNLKPVNGSEKSELVTIPIGSTPAEIGEILEKAGVIRKSWAFEWYVRTQGVRDKLQAGTYSLKPSQNIQEIVDVLSGGRIATDLITIYPAKRIDEVRDDLINQGFDAVSVDDALNPAHYANHPALVDKPAGANLEGYLFPESFQKTAATEARDIILASLDQMQLNLTPEVRAGVVRQGLTVHQGIILASIIELEVGNKDPEHDLEDKKKVAQVFLKRLKENIALESDATAGYGAVLAGEDPDKPYSSPYNTYENPGLTPGPISNVGKNSLLAVANPASTDYLFFVAGNDCVTRFSHTLQEHDNLKKQHGIGCKHGN